MNSQTHAQLSAADDTIQRARESIDQFSRQPRFTNAQLNSAAFDLIANNALIASLNPPEYRINSRPRDIWLSQFWRRDTHLSGVLDGVVAIDKNRGWTLTGGRNQVARYEQVLHNWQAAPGRLGWRSGISALATSYYSTDLGELLELGTEGKSGPLRALYHLDPTRCNTTGDDLTPIAYYPKRGKKIDFGWDEILWINSMTTIEEEFHGLGYCAVSRCIEVAKIMLAIYQYDLEQLGAAAPRGLLLLPGLTRQQWDEAMEARSYEKEGRGFDYFSPVAVIAGGDNLDAKLLALSQLPADFSLNDFTNLLMYAYSLAFGYDPSEFWPVQYGSIGRGAETQIQHDKATGKGGLDFILSFQEQLQQILPESLEFMFDNRDDKADLLQAQIYKAWGDAIDSMRATQNGAVEPLHHHARSPHPACRSRTDPTRMGGYPDRFSRNRPERHSNRASRHPHRPKPDSQRPC